MSRIAANKLANRLKTKEVNVDVVVDKLASQLMPNSVAPTVRTDGSALVAGDTYFNTTTQADMTYTSGGWVKTISSADIVDALTSTDPAKALSAKQGKTLSDGVNNSIPKADYWYAKAIGEPFPLFTHLAGVTEPPIDKDYRFIKLTAGDAYNTGVLGSESTTGVAPLVESHATITLSGSPMNGAVIQLINTERRVIRAGLSGTLENDQMQGFVVPSIAAGSPVDVASSGTPNRYSMSPANRAPLTDGTNGTPRVGTETRSKNIGATYYMRIK